MDWPYPTLFGTSTLALSMRNSSGCRVSVYCSCPPASSTRGVPQALVDQSIDVVVSAALPRFSMENHALATWPGCPTPVLVAVPSGPSMSKPRVLSTSTGTRTVALDSSSPTRSTLTSNHPSSSPKAVLGTVRSQARVVRPPDARVKGEVDAEVSDQPSGKSSSLHVACHVASRVPVERTSTSTRSVVPGATLGASTGAANSTA